MIDVEDITTLVGKRVVNQYGEFGTIDTINMHPIYPISVIFASRPGKVFYLKNGFYFRDSTSRHIALIEDNPVVSDIDTAILETMTKYKLSPEELISIILERHC